ncbi:hypothetical protein D5S18_18710 [Nocardia panacis]|uniref:Minor tail protein n=1 Tax=Nocardia panacis TaxID=2340916 RepID=A0A3A4KHV4_9NOCA|nr:hypothetical protein [Nocardia panacis]RJO74186.1 hypothetical protein D5S18_18710 [Nocardia panacis]
MAIAVAATRQSLADNYKGLGAWVSLHTGDPGTTGTSEASGGTPAYARKQTTWTSSTGGVVNGSQVTIDVPAGTYTYAGLWSAATGGTFIDKVLITSTALGAQGQILVTPSITVS